MPHEAALAGMRVRPRRAMPGAGALAAALLAFLIPTVSAQATAQGQGQGQGRLAHLSNLHTQTRWGYPSYEAVVRASPTPRSRALGRLRFLTDDGQAEIYIALAERTAPGGQWVRIELPGRPNGQRGWVPRAALGALHTVDGYLHVDERALRATLYRDGRAIFSAPVGVGKASTVTPTGHFYVMEKLTTVNAPIYGPYALGTSAYAPTLSEWPGGGVVGIHGTDEPQMIPGRPSHGCIRMRNADVARLWRLVVVGTPIEISD